MGVKANPSGTYTAIWYVNRIPRQKTFMSERLALDYLAKKRLESQREEVYGLDNKVPIADLIRDYRREVNKSRNSVIRDNVIQPRIEAWLKSSGIRLASQLNKGKLADYERHRRQDGVSQRTINIDLKWINAVLNHAWKHDRISFNSCAKYAYKPDHVPFQRYLSVAEIKAILAHDWQDLIYTMLTTGLRTEEICFLEFSDYKGGQLHIRPKTVYINGKPVKWAPKWGRERWVSLSKDYADDVYLREFFESKSKGFCFVSDDRPITTDALYHRIKRIIKKSGIHSPEEISPHILRHTHISYMVARTGKSRHLSLRNIMENVGISDYATLMRYSQAVKNLAKNLPRPGSLPWQYPPKKNLDKSITFDSDS